MPPKAADRGAPGGGAPGGGAPGGGAPGGGAPGGSAPGGGAPGSVRRSRAAGGGGLARGRPRGDLRPEPEPGVTGLIMHNEMGHHDLELLLVTSTNIVNNKPDNNS